MSLSVLALGLSHATTGAAQQRFPEESCQPIIAVHTDSCQIERIFRCETEQGVMMENQSVEPGDLDFIDQYDDDYEMFRAFENQGQVAVPKVLAVADRFFLQQLIETGSEYEEYIALFRMPYVFDPFTVDVSAHYTLSGKSIELDGTVLLVGKLLAELVLIGTALKMDAHAEIFVDPVRNIFIKGKTRIGVGGAFSTENGNPAALLEPDDPLFKSNTPLYGCGELSLLGQRGMRAKG